jgi:hypothetical protein
VSQPEAQPEAETPPQPESTNVEISSPPVPTPLNEQQIPSVESREQPIASATTAQTSTEQPKMGLNGGGRRKDDLLRKIKNLTRSLKRRS